MVTRKRFDIKGPRWRIFSADSFMPGLIGHLSVKVVDEEDNLLARDSIYISIPLVSENNDLIDTTKPTALLKAQSSEQRLNR